MRNDSHRRQFLAGLTAVGTVAIAGCSSRPWRDDTGSETQFTRSEATSILTDGTALPPVARPEPIDPDSSVLADELARVDTLLESVPESIDSETVPNGVIRASIADRRDSALEYRSEAVDSGDSGRYQALRTTRNARENARTAATALAAIDADRNQLLADLREERAESRSALTDRREAIEYRGTDTEAGRLRGALVAADLEADLDEATRATDRSEVRTNASVVDIGDSAGTVEFATATATVWDHFADRYVAETPDRVDLEPVFRSALAAAIDRSSEVALPDQSADDWLESLVDGEVEQGFEQTLLWDSVRPVYNTRDSLQDAVEADDLGTGLFDALRFEQESRAFDRIRDRFEAGALSTPRSIEPIVGERDRAISAAETAIEAFTQPSLAVSLLADTIQSLGWVDDAIRRKTDGDPERSVSLADEYSEYACLRARLDVLPEAVTAFRDRLFAPSADTE